MLLFRIQRESVIGVLYKVASSNAAYLSVRRFPHLVIPGLHR